MINIHQLAIRKLVRREHYSWPTSFRHKLSAENTSTIVGLTQGLLDIFNTELLPYEQPFREGDHWLADGVTVLGVKGLPEPLREEFRRQNYMTKVLGRELIYAASRDHLIAGETEVSLGRFIVSKPSAQGDSMLVAAISPDTRVALDEEHTALVKFHEEYGIGTGLEWPDYRPHLTLGRLRFDQDEAERFIAMAKVATREISGTPLILEPIPHMFQL